MNSISGLFTQVKETYRHNWRPELEARGIAADFLTGKHSPCPMCGGKDRFRFDDKDGAGTWFCNHCGAGDGISLLAKFTGQGPATVARSLQGRTALPQISGREARTLPTKPKVDPAKAREKRDATWTSGQPIEGTPAWKYLTVVRGLPLKTSPAALRYAADCKTKTDGGFHSGPAILVAMTDLSGNLVQVQRIFIDKNGRKALGDKSKRFMTGGGEIIRGASVKLFKPARVMGVAEGVENALACAIATGIPTWASLSAPLMKSVQLPPMVQEVVIFGDRDPDRAGQEAAEELGYRLIKEGREVKILLPATTDQDWADLLQLENEK